MSCLELNSALSAAVFRKRLSEPGEYSFVSKLSSKECQGKPQIVQLLKTEGKAWEAIVDCKKVGEDVKVFEKRVRNQLGMVPFNDINTIDTVPVVENSDTCAQDVSDCKEEVVKHEVEEQKPFVFDMEGSPRLLKNEDSGNEEEDDLQEPLGDLENLSDVISGKVNLSFNRFKSLMESGQLTLNDLETMRNVRVVEVDGRGQVVQFLCESTKDFNKVNLKELGFNDVKAMNNIVGKKALKKMKEGWKVATEVRALVDQLVSKKGTVFTCDQCEKKIPDVLTVVAHLETNHATMVNQIRTLQETAGDKKTDKKNERKLRRMLQIGLNMICDPRLQIEQVMVTNPNVKEKRKEEWGGNIFQRTAGLLSSLIRVERSKGQKKADKKDNVIMYICKACDTDTYHGGKNSRRYACVEHIERFHCDDFQAWAEKLETASSKHLKSLLDKALAPGFMFKAMQMASVGKKGIY